MNAEGRCIAYIVAQQLRTVTVAPTMQLRVVRDPPRSVPLNTGYYPFYC